MTEELEQKAEAEADKVIIGSGMDRASVIHLKHLLVTMYMQGATENGIQWHDLRKDPNDLPKDDKKYFIYTNLGNYYFTRFRKTYWVSVMTNEFVSNNAVIAWCEIPQFKE